jgi:hypothetical protein
MSSERWLRVMVAATCGVLLSTLRILCLFASANNLPCIDRVVNRRAIAVAALDGCSNAS